MPNTRERVSGILLCAEDLAGDREYYFFPMYLCVNGIPAHIFDDDTAPMFGDGGFVEDDFSNPEIYRTVESVWLTI